ncbi:caspase family protein [Methylobacterium durans]|uniref:caspase family protein n=1 Tax=Methylobacterium durans TaxID=2202825 RepID=UPI002AFF8ED9|nr:caspase family protein [Methylobacterium durans]MEA1835222.1 caspase family protein [Methylobacterium durans]
MVVGATLTLAAEQALADGRRVALVVGVSAYQNVAKLPNPANDASAVAAMFRNAGFDVVSAHNDVNYLDFKRAIRAFQHEATGADIAVIFYAGHGIEISEKNYLLPVDASLADERDVEDEAITLDRLITSIEGAKQLRLVILDACRDNPFANRMNKRIATRAIASGLGRIEPQQSGPRANLLIAFAAKAKSLAHDGAGPHSPFTTALLTNLTAPGLDIRLAFGRVRDEVLNTTHSSQEPFVYGSLGGGNIALVPARAEAAALALMTPPRNLDDLAKSDYEVFERVGSKAAWEVYLNTHKIGYYADLARTQLAKLSSAAPGSAPHDAPHIEQGLRANDGAQVSPRTNAPPVVPVPVLADVEARAWNKLKTSTDAAAIRKFIGTYPSSALIYVARDRLAAVERLAREKGERAHQEREVLRQREEDEHQRKATEAEDKRLEKEAIRRREEAEKAKTAEAARENAEAMAVAKQQDAEDRARAAEAAARRHDEEEAAHLAEMTQRRNAAEERATALTAARAEIEAELAVRKREAGEAARVMAVANSAREAKEKVRLQAIRDQQREKVEKAAVAARSDEERERAKAARTAARQREAEDLRKATEAERAKVEAEMGAEEKVSAERAKFADARRRKATAAANAERRQAHEAAAAAAELKAERLSAAKRREAVEERRRQIEEAAANRRKSEAASRRSVERQAEQAATAAAAAREAARTAHVVQRRPATTHDEAPPYATAPRDFEGGRGPMLGILSPLRMLPFFGSN